MALREVMDDDRCLWTVWDTYPKSARTNVMPGFEGGWLTFECQGEKRRLSPVPPDWTAATDVQLLGYLVAAKVVQMRHAQRGGT